MAIRLQWWWVFWSNYFNFFCYWSFRNLFVLHYYLLSLLFGDFHITRDRLDEDMLYFVKFLNSSGSLILLTHIYLSLNSFACPLHWWGVDCVTMTLLFGIIYSYLSCYCCYVFWFGRTKHAWWSIEQGMTGGWKELLPST